MIPGSLPFLKTCCMPHRVEGLHNLKGFLLHVLNCQAPFNQAQG
jgi:hypothetical protein